ncbi:MAG: tripartite tricarboxylate transporter TctB family protein [Cloacibacillus sp.]
MSDVQNCKYDFIAGTISFIAGVGLYINVQMQDMMKFDLLGSKFFPKVACVGMMLLGGILVLQSIAKLKYLKAEGNDEAETKESFFNRKKALFVVYSVTYFTALEFSAGFLLMTPIYMFLNILLLKHGKPSIAETLTYVIFSIVVSTVTHQFFSKILYLLLP